MPPLLRYPPLRCPSGQELSRGQFWLSWQPCLCEGAQQGAEQRGYGHYVVCCKSCDNEGRARELCAAATSQRAENVSIGCYLSGQCDEEGPRRMIYADTADGRVLAAPGLKGTCPSCHHQVRPRCGKVNIHHWAHYDLEECDSWSEPMTEWHLGWQEVVPPECQEVVMGTAPRRHKDCFRWRGRDSALADFS